MKPVLPKEIQEKLSQEVLEQYEQEVVTEDRSESANIHLIRISKRRWRRWRWKINMEDDFS